MIAHAEDGDTADAENIVHGPDCLFLWLAIVYSSESQSMYQHEETVTR